MDLAAFVSILINIIAPIIIVAALGFLLGRAFKLDAQSLSRTTLYVFSPALVFMSAYRSKLDGEFASIAAFAVIITLLMGIITLILIKVMRYDRLTASAFALSVLFVNAGNYGLPLMLFAFGEEGLARAVIFFTVSVLLIQTLAVFIAAGGSASALDALKNVFRMPLFYAVVFGLVFNQLRWGVPEPLLKSLDLMGAAAIPVMLIILGVELSRSRITSDRFHIGLAAFAKLAITPAVAFALAALMGMTGTTRAVVVIQASMPTAVMASVLAVEFNARPEFVTGAVFLSTLASIVSLTLLVGILK